MTMNRTHDKILRFRIYAAGEALQQKFVLRPRNPSM